MPTTPIAPNERPSFWLDSLSDAELTRRAPLDGSVDADVAIVGAGFTGLWTALSLLQRDPSVRVVVIESQYAGFGASGRNGGWVSALLPMELGRVAAAHGRDAARRLQLTMNDTVSEIGATAAAEGIECDFVHGGYLHNATNPVHLDRLRGDLAWAETWGIDGLQWLDRCAAEARVGLDGILGSVFNPHCAVVHPAKLVRGLAEAVERRGGRIVEGTRALAIAPGRVVTDRGTVRAPHCIRALEGFTSRMAGQRRTLVPIYSLMVATEPLPAAFWERAGLVGREVFNDARRRVIYGQRTADDRLAFGGRGAFYHWGSAIRPEFDQVERVHTAIRSTLRSLFPYLPADARFTHAWGGPLGAPRDWTCSVGLDRSTGIGWAGGYVGDGVSTTNLAGRTLADLVLGIDTELTSLPWVGHHSRRWEPEPLRWLGVNAGLALAGVEDRYEARHGKPNRLVNGILNRLTGH